MAKKLNARCPLQAECERKCAHEGHELDCDYYHCNARPGLVIEDQETIRWQREREREDQLYGELLAAEDGEDPAEDGEDTAAEAPAEEYVATTGKLVMIPVEQLYPHPDNPRKELGDLTELAESIKANGVLQNLTVVPGHKISVNEWVAICKKEGVSKDSALATYDNCAYAPDGYMVIIGHRRMGASKVAGLTELPCVVVEMTPEEQVATMLTENMQRTDLTLYEQAKSFQQLSIDFGKSVEEISAMSGFSETTVRKRKRLAGLDEKKFKKACERGATLFDFAELDKVEDPADKERCLDAIGTANFKNVLSTVLDEQKAKKRRAMWLEQLATFATKIEKQGYVGEEFVEMRYFRNYGSWSRVDNIEKPSDADEVRYFYIVRDSQIDIYREYVVNSAEEAEQQRKQELRDKQEAKYAQLCEISKRHYKLRADFIANYGKAKTNSEIISRNAANAIMHMARAHSYYYNYNFGNLAKLMDIPCDEKSNSIDREAFKKRGSEAPDYTLMCMAYWLMDGESKSYINHEWDSKAQLYMARWQDNQTLDEVYYFLEELGYQTSDEERQMRRGTHHLFDPPAEE